MMHRLLGKGATTTKPTMAAHPSQSLSILLTMSPPCCHTPQCSCSRSTRFVRQEACHRHAPKRALPSPAKTPRRKKKLCASSSSRPSTLHRNVQHDGFFSHLSVDQVKEVLLLCREHDMWQELDLLRSLRLHQRQRHHCLHPLP